MVCVRPPRLFQTDRHFGGDPGLTVEDARERVAGHTLAFGSLGLVHRSESSLELLLTADVVRALQVDEKELAADERG